MSRQVFRRVFTTTATTPVHRIPPSATLRYLSTTLPLRDDLEASTSKNETPQPTDTDTNVSWVQEQERQKILALREKYIPEIIQQIERQVNQVDSLLRGPRNEHELEKLQLIKRELLDAKVTYDKADQQLLDVLNGKY